MSWSRVGEATSTLSCLSPLSFDSFADRVNLGAETDKRKRISTDPLLLILVILTGNGTLIFGVEMFDFEGVKFAAIL
jgi:hypothetical protein